MPTSDRTVIAKTGKSWAEWFEQLDRAGALEWDHKTIARHLAGSYPLGGWWSQTIAVAYEQARGMREQHQRSDGFSIQRERVLAVSVERAWAETRSLKWLPEVKKSDVRRIREDRRLLVYLNWPDGTEVIFGVIPKSEGKCSVGVQQSKLPSRVLAEQAKEFWARRLDGLRKRLENDPAQQVRSPRKNDVE